MSCGGLLSYAQLSQECLSVETVGKSLSVEENHALNETMASDNKSGTVLSVTLLREAESDHDAVSIISPALQLNKTSGLQNASEEAADYSRVLMLGNDANLWDSKKAVASSAVNDDEVPSKMGSSKGSLELGEQDYKKVVAVPVEGTTDITDEDDICCICLEEYTEENPVLYGECKHHFHFPCLMDWKQRSNVCPMCASETLRGLADDIESTQPVAVASDDILSILFERYAHRRERRNRRNDSNRVRRQERTAVGRGQNPVRGHLRDPIAHHDNAAPNQQLQRNENGGQGIRTAAQRFQNTAASRAVAESMCRVNNGDEERSGFLALLGRILLCCKR